MSAISEMVLEIFRYIKSEESKLYSLEKEQDGFSDIAHSLEPDANKSYQERLKYINAVQDMRKFRAGLMAHHEYIWDLQLRYMEMNNKITLANER